jgi:hypothetical protein
LGLFVTVVFSVAISFPWRRRRQLRELADELDGTFSEDDDFGLHRRAKPLLNAGELIGVSVRVEYGEYTIELFDIHAGPGGIPKRTCARFEPKRSIGGQSRHIKVRAMEGTDRCRIRGADLTDSEGRTVQHLSRDLRGILDVRIENGAVWICSNGSYHPASEWETLIERGPEVATVLSNPDTIPP